MPVVERQVKEYRITYKPPPDGAGSVREVPGIIAVIRETRLVGFTKLDFPDNPNFQEEDVSPMVFVDGWMERDWAGWIDFMLAINDRLNISTAVRMKREETKS